MGGIRPLTTHDWVKTKNNLSARIEHLKLRNKANTITKRNPHGRRKDGISPKHVIYGDQAMGKRTRTHVKNRK